MLAWRWMQNFDVALKELFQSMGTSLTERFGGAAPIEWLNVELPETKTLRADFVCRLTTGALFHIEFQSYNDADLILRMLDYLMAIRKKYAVAPKQVVLYIGREPMRMPTVIDQAMPRLTYEVEMVDLGNLDAEGLLSSEKIGDVILAILNRQADSGQTLWRILDRLRPLEPEQRIQACRLLLILSAKRNLGDTVIKGVEDMSLLIDPMEDTFFRRLYEKGLTEGEERREASRKELKRVWRKVWKEVWKKARLDSCFLLYVKNSVQSRPPLKIESTPRHLPNWNYG